MPKTKQSKKTPVVEDESTPDVVDSKDVILSDKKPMAPDVAVDSSEGEETKQLSSYDETLQTLENLLEYEKKQFKEMQKHHRIKMAGLKNAISTFKASHKGKKKKSGAKKGTNNNSGITEKRNISETMRKFLGVDEGTQYCYTSLCGAIMKYGEDNNLKGMPTTNAKGEETVNNSYIKLDAKLKKLFNKYDEVHTTVTEEYEAKVKSGQRKASSKPTLMKKGKTRYINRSGIMKLIGEHLIKVKPVASEATTTEVVEESA